MRYLFFWGLFLIMAAVSSAAADGWQTPDNWQKIEKRMNEQEVIAILGKPLARESAELTQVWYYQTAPRIKDGKTNWRPDYGFVRFKKGRVQGQETILLYDWRLPQWKNPELPPEDDSAARSNPAGQIKNIEEAYSNHVNQLEDIGSQGLSKEKPSLPSGPVLPAIPGNLTEQSIEDYLNSAPHNTLLLAGGGVCLVLFLLLLIPRKPKRKRSIPVDHDSLGE